MPSPSDIWYVYGVVPREFDLDRAPGGLDDASLELCEAGEVAAIVSRLDGREYAPSAVEQSTENVEWLAPRAVAHDRVLTWASDHGPLVPLPIFSLFSGAPAVQGMLRERRAQLESALRRAASGREYALRVYRIDSELTKAAPELSPRLAELQDAAAAASPGQRYLLERKLDVERKNELHSIGSRIAREVVDRLRPLSIDTSESRIAPRGARSTADAALILDAAFLVEPQGLEKFQRELSAIVERHQAHGFRFDFTGPWPLYHFVQDDTSRSRDDV